MSGTDADQSSRPSSRGFRLALGATLLAGLMGVLTGLVATAPASLVTARLTGAGLPAHGSGTLWSGNAIMANGLSLGWDTDMAASVLSLGLKADWMLDGPDTVVSGRAHLSSRRRLSDIRGNLGWAAIRTFAPDLASDCDLVVKLDLGDLVLDERNISVRGAASTLPATCAGRPLPALDIRAADPEAETLALIIMRSTDGVLLAELSLLGLETANVSLTPDGAQVFLGRDVSGPVTLEMEL